MDKSNDAFHHEDYVKNLKKIIEEHEPPFNIALIGKWGVGKSSIINLLKKELHGKKEVVTHEINAWKYENDSLKKAFLKNLWQTFNKDNDVSIWKLYADSFRETTMFATMKDKPLTTWQTIKAIFPLMIVLVSLFLLSSAGVLALLYIWDGIHALFSKNTFIENTKDTFKTFKTNIWVAIIIAPLYKMLQDFLKSSMQTKMADVKLVKPVETADEYEQLFKDEIDKYKVAHPKFKKLVVIVDDLDRLSTKKVVAALDAIKAFVEINECIFIVTCDENILINAIEKEKLNKTDDIDGELFLDKLFHFRITLPPIIENDMSDFAIRIAKQEAQGLVKLCNGHFEKIIDILIHAEVSTPRQVKKLLNTFANNLLIANSREAESRKLEQQLLTGEKGILFLAKLSVIQSDYNDIYMELSKDFDYLEELLDFYQAENEEAVDIKPSIKLLFIYKDSTYKIKHQYEGLINFLSRTQHITVDNLSPFIYLAQDAIGLKAGDEKQRAIRKNLLSGNEKGIINLLNEDTNPENLAFAIIEEVKHSSRKDVPSVMKAAIPLISHISEGKKELADTISHKLTTVGAATIRFWQIEYQYVLNVYHSAENKIGIENALLFVMDELFSKSENWKNPQGKEMTNEAFVNQISKILNNLMDAHEDLPISVREKLRAFLAGEDEGYMFFPFENIQSLYNSYSGLFWDYFNMPFFNQLVNDMENAEGKVLEEDLETFFGIAPKIREKYASEFILSVPSVITSSTKNKVLDVVRLLVPIVNRVNEKSGVKIVDALTAYVFEPESINEVMKIIQQIRFDVKDNEDFAERLDEFILNHLPEEKDETMEEVMNVIEYVLQEENVDFGQFDQVFNYVLGKVLNTSIYDELIGRFNKTFTDSQRSALFATINSPVLANSYNASLSERIYTLYAILGEEKVNDLSIQQVMQQGITLFVNNSWLSYLTWANDFVKLFSVTADKIDETDLLNYIHTLLNQVTSYSHSNLAIKGLMYIGEHVPPSKVLECINYVLNHSNSDSSKMDALEFLKSCNQYITRENNNLNSYAAFLLDNFPLKVENFLNELYSQYRAITDKSVIKLITNAVNLEEEKLQSNLSTIQRTTGKFFSALDTEKDKLHVLHQLLEENMKAKDINSILLMSLEKSSAASLLDEAIKADVEKHKNYKLELLKLCGHHHQVLDKGHLTNLIVDVLRESDDDYIVEICVVLLKEYNTFRFVREKKHISAQVVPTFRNVNMEAKEKVLEIAKAFHMEKEFEHAIKDNLLSTEEAELVIDKLGFRRKRMLNTTR